MIPRLALLVAFGLPVACARTAFSQSNHVIIRDFQWKIVSTDHFDIHYYEGSEPLVPWASAILERSYKRISKELGTTLDKRRPFFLYANVNDMEQSNIVQVGDGTGGVTEPLKDRFIVYNDGSRQWLDDVITHELTHVFQYQVLISGFWRSIRIIKTVVYPLWMMEGMAEYSTWGLDDTSDEVIVRDAATSNGFVPLWKLEHFAHLKPHQIRLAYESGHAALAFLESQFGPGRIESILKMFESRFESSAVLRDLIGLDIFGFDKRWREYEQEKARRTVRLERLKEPGDYGSALTRNPGDIPEFNTTPVFTPDGRSMAYLSTRDGFPPSVMLKDLRTGKLRRLVEYDARIETISMGNFANVSRVLAISPDGRLLAFAGTKNHRDSIYLYDVKRGSLERVPVRGMMTVSQPAFSPDGNVLAFSAMKDAFTDIYTLDLRSRKIRQLTSDRADDQTPCFSPDGRFIVYSSEVEFPGDAMLYQRRLYRIDLSDLSTQRLTDVHGAARDPVYSPNGKRVLFALEDGGFYDIHELDLATGEVARLTRSIGASYTPIYTPEGEIAFAAFRRGDVHVFRGPRGKFISERVARKRTSDPDARIVEPADASVARTPERPYEPSYSTDLFVPALFYSSNGGLFWSSYWQGSDMLGNHQAQSVVSYASGLGFLNYQTLYSYDRYRPQLSVSASGYRYRNNYDPSSGLSYNESVQSESVGVSYPLDRYLRIDLVTGAASQDEYVIGQDQHNRREARQASASVVRDTRRGRYLVATQGSQLSASYLDSPRVLGGNFVYQGYSLQGVKYFPTGDLSSLVVRGVGVEDVGSQTPQNILGGLGGVRGYGRSISTNVGSRMTLSTLEYRFPILSNLDYYMWYIFPDFYFKAITAAIFTDAGYVWDNRSELAAAQWKNIRQSYGVGLRIHTFLLQEFPLIIHFDYARRTTSNGGIFYVYLGPLF